MRDTDAATDYVAVWDWPVRVVHWSIVVLVMASVTTGLVGSEAMTWHMRSGQLLLALVIFRIAWGFVGSANARFASFLRGPAEVAAYARSLIRPPHHPHVTHNPLGGWMVVALLLALLVQATTGLFTADDVMNEGPLAKLASDETIRAMGKVHRRAWWLLVALASVHIVAVIGYFAHLGEDLVYPMVSGEKVLPTRLHRPHDAAASTPRALVLLAMSALAVWWICYRL